MSLRRFLREHQKEEKREKEKKEMEGKTMVKIKSISNKYSHITTQLRVPWRKFLSRRPKSTGTSRLMAA